jgi:shikimate kinase
MNIYLIGFRCTGKTTIGKIISKELNMDFIDADDELVKQQGEPISEIVEKHGWDYFRDKESDVLKEISSRKNYVVATGGGVILKKENIDCMKKNGTVIWLRANPDTVKNRMLKDEKTEQSRPSLTSKGLIDEIKETIETRNPLYTEAMDFDIITDDVGVEEVTRKMLKRLENG